MPRFLGLVIVAVLVSPTFAAPNELELVPLERAPLPVLAKSVADCKANGTTLVKRELKVGATVFQSRQGCGWGAMAALAITNGQITYTTGAVTIEYRAANMTEAPLHLRPLETRLSAGTLANGDAVVVHQVDVLHEEVCTKPGCGKDSARRIQYLNFCTPPKGSAPPACSTTSFECPTTGCKAATLARGALAVHTVKGTQSFTVRADG